MSGSGCPDLTALRRVPIFAPICAPIVASPCARAHQHVPGRYRMHDLVALYAAELANQDRTRPWRDDALRRLVAYYTTTAHAGDLVLGPHWPPIEAPPVPAGCHPQQPSDTTAAMEWFETEYDCLLAVQRLAVQLDWHEPAWQLAWCLRSFHLRHGHLAEEILLWLHALAAAQKLGNLAYQAIAHRYLGTVLTDLDEDAGRSHLRQALLLFEQTDDHYGQADAHRALAWVLERQGDMEGALVQATLALQRFRALELPIREAEALNEVGWRHARLGNHAQAQTHCEAALELNRRLEHREGEAATLDSLGYIAHHNGRHADAISHYHDALRLYRELEVLTVVVGPTLTHLAPPRAARRTGVGNARLQHRDVGGPPTRLTLTPMSGRVRGHHAGRVSAASLMTLRIMGIRCKLFPWQSEWCSFS